MSTRSALDACKALDDIAGEVKDRMFAQMQERSYGAGDYLIRQGEGGEGLLLIAEGRACVQVRSVDGGADRVGEVDRGALIGEMPVVTREARSADVVAEMPVVALALPGKAFHALALESPELGVVLTHLVADRLGQGSIDGLGHKLIHGYRIVRSVGRGAMAVVYEAECVETGEHVALKMMSHRLAYELGARARFRQEADIVQSFEHENIVRLYGRFHAYNTEFLVLELCTGATLQALIGRHGSLSTSEVRKIVGQLARALDYVHGRGVVHRDLKPANVIVTGEGVVKLMDFGVALPNYKLTDQTVTLNRSVVGTPAYMSPEQLASKPVDAAADVYALACVAYELLVGAPPFGADNLVDLIQQKTAFVLPPGGGAVDADPALRAFIERGLTSDPAHRASVATVTGWAQPVDTSLVSVVQRDSN